MIRCIPHPLVVNMGLDFKQDLKTKVVNYGKRQADAFRSNTAEVGSSC